MLATKTKVKSGLETLLLCLKEVLLILESNELLILETNLIGTCRHLSKLLLKNCRSVIS